jgi:hypothetical protein
MATIANGDQPNRPYRAEDGAPEFRKGRQLDDNQDDLGRDAREAENEEIREAEVRDPAPLAIYRLLPIARPDDSNWDRTTDQGEVLVRARSTGDARVVAADGEARAAGKDPALETTQILASAFHDSHLYAVRLATDTAYPADGPREVLEARFHAGPTGPGES